VTLDSSLQASSRFLEFVMRMFAEGSAVVPAAGMQAIPNQLVSRLPEGSVMLDTPVEHVSSDGSVDLASGDRMSAKAVVVATDGGTARQLTGGAIPKVEWSSVICLYFAASQQPIDEPTLVLNGSGSGLVNNFAVMSAVAPTYAPPGSELLSVTVLEEAPDDDRELQKQVMTEMRAWFGDAVDDWELLEIQRIPRALPRQAPPTLDPPQRSVALSDRLFVCGDHRDTASIEGAIVSGQRTAEAILNEA
jgi:phytoene dehydrogenase-like protein